MVLLGSVSIVFVVLVFVGIVAYRKHCWSPLHQKQSSLNGARGGAEMVVGLNGMSFPVNRTTTTTTTAAEYDEMTQR